MKFAVLVFPGTNGHLDMYHAVKDKLGEEVEFVQHDTKNLDEYEAILIPGGSSYGDYLRAGAIARQTPIMKEVARVAKEGKPILGIGNGFQILLEAGLLPGAMLQNKSLKFTCQTVQIVVHNNDTIFSRQYTNGEVIDLPIAHSVGNYYCDEKTLQELKNNNQIVFTYNGTNPNGSIENIAGITNKQGNVLGMMPHPERAVDKRLGSNDGLKLFKSIVQQWREANAVKA
ncbi:phosphoribosylformylglycinamidine synthase subunit PurQ [Caldibacillus thermolactis]|uniref:Phosphoribosylformylglycinamidine synthase subunit PurQ n=1 Tax=Pallidibacillus thermolactis TaxID=251051 RepID=A0ABT2WEY8_9BACI|nr:phosphoribosylformylglycinamidine synthase subunit PurQ [Pallidibacillus thermolactis]MCU9594243.1 phosphoribosylformylglycinamidine synthase subunit PurQ [Pallidibacillus thermolactis]